MALAGLVGLVIQPVASQVTEDEVPQANRSSATLEAVAIGLPNDGLHPALSVVTEYRARGIVWAFE